MSIQFLSIFLKNFYTGLDFDKNMVMLGLNTGGSSNARISGKAMDPNLKKGKNEGAIVGVIMAMLIMFGIALFCFLKAKKNERERVVTFAPTTQTNAKKVYRNGVEVKPSELDQNKSAKFGINDSAADIDNEETLLDNEQER